jgi:hypothetical protein
MLPQYRGKPDPVFHKFTVFSVLDLDSDTVEPKFTECNNCGAAHKVIDLCKSEIVVGKDEVKTQITIDDIKHSLPSSLFELLLSYDKELPDFEHALFIMENNLWGNYIVLTREDLEEYTQGKIVTFVNSEKFKVESYTHRSTV